MGEPSSALGLVWAAQWGPQQSFVTCPMFEVVYGGARGGGKTDASLGDFALHANDYGRHAKGLFVRRTRVALEPTIARAKQIYQPMGATWREQRSRFEWKSGARLYFRYLDRDADADAFQGHDYTRVYVEELTQFADPRPIEKLKATLRSAHGIPTGFRASCNPGGPGHTWVKERYIDAGPWQTVRETFQSPFGGAPLELARVFIPARLDDNPLLLKADPLYVAKLQQAGSEALVRAWLEGDWSVVEGAYFDTWSTARNVVRPFEIPEHWTRFRAFDWGSARPFSVGWWAVASEPWRAGEVILPRGAIVRYREWYGSTGRANEGLKLTAEVVARGLLEREKGEAIAYGVADPSIFREDGGPSIGERMRRAGVAFRPADNARVAGSGALGGWDQMRARMKGVEEGPMLAVFSTCRDFIRTVPILQHDRDRPEDLDTAAEDHIADECRYACMSRPWVGEKATAPRNPPDLWGGRRGGSDWKTA